MRDPAFDQSNIDDDDIFAEYCESHRRECREREELKEGKVVKTLSIPDVKTRTPLSALVSFCTNSNLSLLLICKSSICSIQKDINVCQSTHLFFWG